MNPTPEQLKKLERLAKILDNPLAVFKYVSDLEDKIDEDISAIENNTDAKIEKALEKVESVAEEVKSSVPNLDDVLKSIKGKDSNPEDVASILKQDAEFQSLTKGDTYKLTEDDETKIAQKIKVPIVEKVVEKVEVIREQPIVTEIVKEVAVPETADEIIKKIEPKIPELGLAIRNGLELLNGDERLDKSAIKGIEEIENKLERKVDAGFAKVVGLSGLRVYVDGAKRGILKEVNFKAGTNVTLTSSIINGLETITFNSSGSGGGGGWKTPTGTVNGTNAVFTTDASETPALVVADGMTRVSGKGYTFLAGTITMDTPPLDFIRYST